MQTSGFNIIASNNNKELKLNYLCETSHVIYSISDLSGNIIQHGNYDYLIDSTIQIIKLRAGKYILCIIDGGEFCKTSFIKS